MKKTRFTEEHGCLKGMPPSLQSLIHARYGSPRWPP